MHSGTLRCSAYGQFSTIRDGGDAVITNFSCCRINFGIREFHLINPVFTEIPAGHLFLVEEIVNLLIAVHHRTNGSFNQFRSLPFFFVVYREIDRIMVNEIFICPYFLHGQTPAFLISHIYFRIHLPFDRIADRRGSMWFFRNNIRTCITVRQTQGISLWNFIVALFHLPVNAVDQIPDFNCIICRNLGNSTARRGFKYNRFLLRVCQGCQICFQITVVTYAQRYKLLLCKIPTAVIFISVFNKVRI